MIIDRIHGRSNNIMIICNMKIQNEIFVQVKYLQNDNMFISFQAAKERKRWSSVVKVSQNINVQCRMTCKDNGFHHVSFRDLTD